MKKIIAALLMGAALSSQAASTTGILLVQAQVAGACTLNVVNINFGTVTLSMGKTGQAISTGKIITNCTKDTPYTIKIGAGNAGNFTGSRRMTSANATNTDILLYNIYRPTTSIILGDGTNGTSVIEKVADGFSQEETIQASIPYSQAVSADLYTDSVSIVVEY